MPSTRRRGRGATQPNETPPRETTEPQRPQRKNQQANLSFTQAQRQQIKKIVEESIAAASSSIAGEAARAAVNALQNQPSNTNNPNDNSNSRRQQHKGTDKQSGDDNNELEASGEEYSTPFQDPIPSDYVKDIQYGEFFDLSKLLPKNLSNANDEPFQLTLENSVIKLTKAKSATITDIEQWTTAFTTYMCVFTRKFPNRSQEMM